MYGTAGVLQPDLIQRFARAAASPDPGLAGPALLIARFAYPRLDPGPYLSRLEEMGADVATRLLACDPAAGPQGAIETLNRYLFDEQGFAGDATRYDDLRNSLLNQVLERRTGIPITLALVYIEVARLAGVRVEGVNFPGHFLLRVPFGDSPDSPLIIDPFDRGAALAEADCRALLRRHAGDAITFEPRLLAPATKQQILVRILVNLKRIYIRMRSFPQGRAITELLLALNPSALNELRDRGLLAYHLDDLAAALRDLETYLKFASRGNEDENEDSRDERAEIWGHVKALRRRVASLN